MLSSITPLGERAKQNSWVVTTTAYVAGSLIGGTLLGLLLSPLAAVAALAGTTATLVLLAIALLAAGLADRKGIRPPSLPRQVDENWLTAYRGWVYGFGFGVQLGFGLVTIITSWSMWGVVAAIVLSAGGAGIEVPWPLPFAPMLTGAAFGLARGLALIAARRVVDTGSLAVLHRQIASRAARTASGVAWALTGLGVLAGIAALSGAAA